MISAILLCGAINLGGFAPDGPPPGPPERDAYKSAAEAAGRDAGAHVRLALWCEQHGMTAERMKHLAAAVLYDPSNALARGLMGLVAYHGKWERPDDVTREAKDDPKRKALMQEYLERRARAADKADDQWKLAVWCDHNGLKDQAIAHYHAVLRLDPRHEAAWKHLGFKKSGGRWVKPEWQEAARREAEEQGRANKHWKPLLEQWRAGLSSRDKARRSDAEAGLASVTDPRAVPMVWAVFVTHRSQGQKVAVRVLGQLDSPGSSRALALLAVFGRPTEVRRAAAETLRRRDPRDFLGVLIGMVRDPLKYQVRPGPERNSPGELFVEGQRYNVRRQYYIENDLFGTYDLLTRMPPRYFDSSVPFDPFGPQNLALAARGMAWNTGPWATVQMAGPQASPATAQNPHANAVAKMVAGAGHPTGPQAQANIAVMQAQSLAAQEDILIAQRMMAAQQVIEISRQQLRDDIQAVEAYNADARRVNDLVVPILTDLTGRELGSSREAWEAWWTDQRGYAYTAPDPSTKPTYTELVENPVILVHNACFGSGTLVHTLDGLRAIESIRAGDQVLSQDVRTGKLAFTPVVAIFHNKPAPTLRLELEDQAIVVTGIHRFWKAGKGWAMARELRPGDVLRTLGGVATVKSIEAEKTQPVFNLQVADGESYFVGSTGVLAHDNSTVNPVPEPFDAVGAPSAVAAPGKTSKPKTMLGR